MTSTALVAPLAETEGRFFPTRIAEVQVLSASVYAEPLPTRADDASAPRWLVELDLVVRNHQDATRVVPLAFAPDQEFVDATRVWFDGDVVATTSDSVGHDPALPDHLIRHPLRATVELQPLTVHTIRVVTGVRSQRDTYGQTFLRLPLHLLSLFDESLPYLGVTMRLDDRALALQSTVRHPVVYDAPDSMLQWFVRNSELALPFEVSWIDPWSALIIVAETEACPGPWDVVRAMSTGDIVGLEHELRDVGDDTLAFCAGLPAVLRGAPIANAEAADQLASIDMRRYLPGDTERGPLYRSNDGWDEDQLTDPERLYRNALRTLAESRSSVP
jgi:hypothetical protein